jgi:hypothetical protein
MMPTEDDLKRMFESVDVPSSGGIDAKQVIRRSRARRLPKQLAAGAGGALALVGVTVLGLQSVQFGQPQSADAPMSQESSDSESSGGAAEDSAFSTKRAPADKLNLCGGPVVEGLVSQFGLVLDVVFPASAAAASERIDGMVIMTNTSTEPVKGSTFTIPAVTLSQDGVVVWHTNGATDASATVVDLAPGASMQYAASFEPVRCAPEDEALEAFPADLPPVGAGSYELSAAIDFSPDVPTATTELDLVTGPRMPITLE